MTVESLLLEKSEMIFDIGSSTTTLIRKKSLSHSVYNRTVSSQYMLSTFLNQIKLDFGPFRQRYMPSTLWFRINGLDFL